MIKPAVVMLAAIAACTGLAPAQAAAQSQRTALIQYNDLDLQKAEQRAILDARLQDAVSQVCGKTSQLGIQEFHEWHRCMNEARNSADKGRAIALANATTPRPHVIIEQD
ncbi:UrcA family protein [Novosphingobium album (ex Hu et al. 2023)]|uniref:UrcA family protein n=1 Tax=Novosphingobium album (ex Hu et al. 2023) TaxID=2930093 RepID=A0ABT0B2Z8_9SPHN|nr:UrcA family protein [Novosphingobium album (ex Hu et al. 2023)]MCJ2179420.1 UrcA family protein [Novosphingobium album (ex Hu et al. 2023)]